MNILIISEYFYPRIAGGELTTWNITNGLSKRGHKIYVVTGKMNKTKAYEFYNKIEIYRPIKNSKSIIGRFLFSLKLYFFLRTFIKYKNIDLIYNISYLVTIPSTIIARSYNIPIITSIRSYLGKTWFTQNNLIFAIINYFIENLVIRYCHHDVLHFPSKYVLSKIKTGNKTVTKVIYNPLDVNNIKNIKNNTNIKLIRENLNIKDNELFLLFVGALIPVKNIIELINVLLKFKKKYKLIIVGEGPDRKKIEYKLKEYNLINKVVLLGEKSHTETLKLIYSSDFLILPSKSETFSNVVLEGLAFEKIVISTKVGAVPEMKSKNLLLINSINEINKILESDINPVRDDRVINQFSNMNIIDEFEKFFIKTLKNYNSENL